MIMNQTLLTLTEVLGDALNDDDVTSDQVLAAIKRELNDSVEYHRKRVRKCENLLSELNSVSDRIVLSAPPSPDMLYNMDGVPDVDFSAPAYWGNDDTITSSSTSDTISLG